MSTSDPRRTPYRSDIAALKLRGLMHAKKFVSGTLGLISTPCAPLFRSPNSSLPRETELLFGERFHVYEEVDGWCWGQSLLDDYVGYVPQKSINYQLNTITHKVSSLRTFVYEEPHFKSPVLFSLSFGAQVSAQARDVKSQWLILDGGGFILEKHLSRIGSAPANYVESAELFEHVPYLWGGRGYLGIDCSGLVQISLQSSGRRTPRDCDMQHYEIGRLVKADKEPLMRGDLIFWEGHTGILRDKNTIIHASGWHMEVVSESIESARHRVDKTLLFLGFHRPNDRSAPHN